jgi:hypothetical protein
MFRGIEPDIQPSDSPVSPNNHAPDGLVAASFTHGNSENGITLRSEGRVLRVSVCGDPPQGALLDCFRDAFAAGAVGPEMSTLVDLTSFNGKIDWPSVRGVKALTPWKHDQSRTTRVAYLSASPWFNALLKLVSEFYPQSQHRQFEDESAALVWLLTDHR